MAELQERALWLAAGDSGDKLEEPDLEYLFAYWSRAAGDRPAPRRQDIDPPIDLPGYLPTTIMFNVERDAQGGLTFRYRLVGTRLVDNAGREVRGKTIEEAFSSEILGRDLEIYREVVETLRCYRGDRMSLVSDRQLYERYTRLVMPVLGDESGEVDMIWSWLKFEGAPRAAP